MTGMTGAVVTVDGRWARMGMALVGMALLAVALPANVTPPTLFGTLNHPTPSAQTTSSYVLPAGLEEAISASLGEAYLIGPGVGGDFEARNSRQDLEARFSAEGIRVRPTEGQWSFDISLARYGRQDQLFSVPASQPVALGARVEYERGAFTEWYENRPQGIEHGFILVSPPPGDGLVTFELSRTDTLSAGLSSDARSVAFSDSEGTVVLRYQDLVVSDAGGEELSASLSLGLGTISLLVDDRGAAYPITIDPLLVTEQAHPFASDGAAHDQFGRSVALAGDTALVGARLDDTAGGEDAGSAYVFVRSGTTWTVQAHLFASDGATGDLFGFSVALAGDTALVGARQDNTAAGVEAGSAYVFVRSGTTWSEQAHLFASDGSAEDRFGWSVALAGDTALVGALLDDIGSDRANAGSAYVFVRSGTTWTEQAHIFASDGAAADDFGFSVALAGDTALVGAWRDNSTGGEDAGSAYVFVRSGTTWTEQAHIFASDGARADLFGFSVALAGDTALVGAVFGDTAAGVDVGSAYVFVRTGTTWTEQAHLFASDGAENDAFGESVALAGGTALVGARSDDTAAGEDVGSAYVFVRSGTTWTVQAHLFASDGAAVDEFGFSVALAGDTALVGAWGYDTAAGVNVGSAYVFVISAAQPAADLEVSLAVVASGAHAPAFVAGESAVYTITVDNLGPSDNTGYSVSFGVPVGISFDSASAGCAETLGTVTCPSGGLTAAGAPQTVDVTVNIGSGYVIANDGASEDPVGDNTAGLFATATVASTTTPDNNATNDLDTVTVDVVGVADLAVTSHEALIKDALAVDPLVSGNFNFLTALVTVFNNGPSDAQNVAVTDTFPTSGGNPLLHKTTEDAAVGILLAFASADVSFQADVRNDLRDGPYPSTNTANVDSSVTTDDLPVNDSLDDLVDVFTVPDAPVLEDAEGGNGQIAVVWRRGTNPTGGDPDGVAGYDVILTPTSPAGPAVICFFDGDAPNAQTGTKFSHICTGLVNGTTYQVSVAARNGAGESDRSNALTAKPCAACAVAVVPNPEQLTIITGDTSGGVGGPGCEQLLKDRKLGATAGNPIIVCDEYPAAETDGNGGLIASVREDPATLGACGAFTCVGGIQFTSNVPFDITNFLREVVIIDKTLLPDNADKSVFVDGVLIGTSDKNSWCTAAPPNFAFGCVEKIATLNKKTAPNGSQGVADLLVVIRFSVNPSKGVGAR